MHGAAEPHGCGGVSAYDLPPRPQNQPCDTRKFEKCKAIPLSTQPFVQPDAQPRVAGGHRLKLLRNYITSACILRGGVLLRFGSSLHEGPYIIFFSMSYVHFPEAPFSFLRWECHEHEQAFLQVHRTFSFFLPLPHAAVLSFDP